jgi:CheY-like chemotaxis protein
LIFLDIAMPGMNGYEVAARLRADGAARQAILVALTGFGQEEDRSRARDAGFDHYLVKPAGIEAIQKLLAEVSA